MNKKQTAMPGLIVHGEPQLGIFPESLLELNVADFAYRHPLGARRSRLRKWADFKQFQYFGGISERFIFGCALVNIRYLGSVFCYVYDVERNRLITRSWKAPVALGMRLNDNPVHGVSRFHGGGIEVEMGYDGSPRAKWLRLSVQDVFRIDATMGETGFQPMSICTRAGYAGWVYANKTAGLPLQGTLSFDGQTHDLATLGAAGHHDFSCGYMRRETYWNWACLSGLAAPDTMLGLNISCGVNETSFSENCLWLNGQLHPVGLANFLFNRRDYRSPWRISTSDGAVELAFAPLGEHREHLNAGVLATHFRQIFGRFDGVLRLADREIPVNGLHGFVEDHFSRW